MPPNGHTPPPQELSMIRRNPASAALVVLACASMALGAAPSSPSPSSQPAPPQVGPLEVAQAAVESPLDLVPRGASISLVVPSLGALHTRMQATADQIAVDAIPFNDLLGALGQQFGWEEGLRATGPLVAWMDPFTVATEGPIVVVPITDYAAFVGGLGATAVPGATTALPTLSGGYFSHARHVGDFAVLGLSAGVVEAVELPAPVPLSQLVGPLGAAAATRGEVALVLNLELLSPVLVPLVNGMFGNWEAIVDDPMFPPESRASMEAMINAYRYVVTVGLTETRASVLTVDLDTAWTAFDWTWQFRPGSMLAAAFASGGPVGDRLSRVPDAPYFLAMAANLEGLELTPLLEGLTSTFPAGDPWSLVMGSAVDLMRGVTGIGTAWYAGERAPEGAQPDSFPLAGYYEVSDGADYLQRLRRYFGELGGLSVPLGPGMAGGMSYEVTYAEEGVTLQGVALDTYRMRMRMPPGHPPLPFSEYSGYIGLLDPTHVLLTTTLDEELLRAALGTLGAGGGLGTRAELEALRSAALTEITSVEMFVDVDESARAIGRMLQAMGSGPLPLEPPAELAPLAVFGHVADGGAAGRLVLPHAVLRWFVQLGRVAAEPSSTPI
jgi:hypothetical protein